MTNRHNCLLLFLATLLIAFLPSQGQASSTPLGSDFLEVVLPFSGPSNDILDASVATAQVPEVGLQNALELIASRIQNVVRVDFVKERWIAEELRRREVPFVLTNIPEVVEATNRWNSDYLELLASAASSTCNTAVKHVPKEWLLKEFPNLASENRSTFFAVDAEHYSPYPAAQEVQLRIHEKRMPVEIHFDRARTFISIIKGSTRNYFLFPPSQCSNLYVQPDCYRPLYRRSLIPDILDVPRVMQEHPQFESAQAIYVELNPGETLYIPSFWFHRIDGMDNHLILKRAGYAKERHEEIASEQCLDSETFREAYHTFPFISFNECLLQEEAPSDTPTPSESASRSPSATLSASFSATISETASATVSATVSATASVSPLVLCGNGVVDLNEECDFNDRSKPSRDRKCCRSDCTFESKDVTCIKETRCFTSAQCNKGTCGGLKLKESCKAKITETPSLPHLKPTKSDSSKSQSAIVATLVLLLCLAVATLV